MGGVALLLPQFCIWSVLGRKGRARRLPEIPTSSDLNVWPAPLRKEAPYAVGRKDVRTSLYRGSVRRRTENGKGTNVSKVCVKFDTSRPTLQQQGATFWRRPKM